MKSRYYATIQDGKVVEMSDSSENVELKDNQIPLTSNELAILRIIRGDISYGRNILRDIEERIANKNGKPYER